MTVKTAVPARARKAELPAVTAEAIAENELAAPFTETPEFKDALAAALAAKLAETKPVKETGHRAYATKPVTDAMVKFTEWINREFPELGGDVDARLVMIASKAYKWFQSSDLNV